MRSTTGDPRNPIPMNPKLCFSAMKFLFFGSFHQFNNMPASGVCLAACTTLFSSFVESLRQEKSENVDGGGEGKEM